MSFELALVMPVYNEADCIIEVVESWRKELDTLQADYCLLIMDDGSTDCTARELGRYKDDPRVRVMYKPNTGHGPTILKGYLEAIKQSPWVFQCDSDNELRPDHFRALWTQRQDYDALFGIRVMRQQNWKRHLISAVSRWTIRLLYGHRIKDVNIPYRLIRSNLLRVIIAQIPQSTFAPNVIISGVISRSRARIFEYPVPHQRRKTGTVSIVKWRLWHAAILAFFQTLQYRPKVILPVPNDV